MPSFRDYTIRSCWAIGDGSKDIIAAKAAGIYAGAALWGSLDKEALLKSNPDQSFETTTELYEVIRENVSGSKIDNK